MTIPELVIALYDANDSHKYRVNDTTVHVAERSSTSLYNDVTASTSRFVSVERDGEEIAYLYFEDDDVTIRKVIIDDDVPFKKVPKAIRDLVLT